MRLEKTYIKRETIEGRIFRIEIFDDRWGFPYTRIVEELRPKKHLFDFNYENIIFCYWVEESEKRIEIAAKKIADFLDREKTEENFKKILDKWCNDVV